ncbi:MAG TPA: alpha/beta hydrolase [Paludibacter sp.]
MGKYLLINLLLFSSLIALGQDITGEWNGMLKVESLQLPLVFHITKTNVGYSATIDSPDQGSKGTQMSKVTFENLVLTLELASQKFEYTGKLDSTNILVGTFKQAGQSFPMNLSRERIEKEKIPSASDVKDTAFLETEIILHTKSGQIFGTLTMPKKFSKIPVALIIAGSGPTDRDGNQSVMQCNAYKKLAYGLAGNNIASLRYDKRGVAKSIEAAKSESDLRFEDYINDAKEWIQLLKQDKRFSKVIVIGHSEGSLIGMIAATNADKYISVAGPGQSIDKALKDQLSTTQSQEVQDLVFPIIDSLANGQMVNSVDPKLNSGFRLSVQPYLISAFKYDPQIEIQKLNIPILIVQGTNDIQVSVENAKRLSKANPKAQLVFIDKMNHIFRAVDGDREVNLETYNNFNLPLADGLVKEISNFILKK